MIRHAPEAFPVGPLAVAVIETSLPAVLVSSVGGPPLLPARFPPASVPRSRPVSGSRNCRCKTPTRSPASGKSTAVTPLLWPSHPARVWNNGPLAWHAGYAVVLPSNRGRHEENPDRCNDRGFPFHLRPCLAGASANCRFRCVPVLSRSSLPQHGSPF